MKVDDALLGVSRLFLDTSPVVYFVEENPEFLSIVSPIFGRIENATLIGVAAPVTLAECLVVPYRMGDMSMQQGFVQLLTNTENIEFVDINSRIGRLAGEIRARYNLQLPDSLQVASAIASNCEAFLTNDTQLKRVTELRVLVLSELEV